MERRRQVVCGQASSIASDGNCIRPGAKCRHTALFHQDIDRADPGGRVAHHGSPMAARWRNDRPRADGHRCRVWPRRRSSFSRGSRPRIMQHEWRPRARQDFGHGFAEAGGSRSVTREEHCRSAGLQ